MPWKVTTLIQGIRLSGAMNEGYQTKDTIIVLDVGNSIVDHIRAKKPLYTKNRELDASV